MTACHWSRTTRAVAAVLLVALALGVFGFFRSGYELFIVHTGSMTPTYRSGDLVLVRADRPYHVGDAITFEHGAGPNDLVTHRIVAITPRGITTKGDANPTDDAWTIRPAQVHGVAQARLPRLGYVAYYLQQWTGIASVLTLAVAVLLLWQLFFARPVAAVRSKPPAPWLMPVAGADAGPLPS